MKGPKALAVALLALFGIVALPPSPTAVAAPQAGGGGPAGVFRVEVSHHPQVCFVIAPADRQSLADMRARLRVWSGGRLLRPTISELPGADLDVVLIPDPQAAALSWPRQQAALSRFVLGLPFRARTGVPGPASPLAPIRLSADPARSLLTLTAPRRPSTLTAAERLEAALAPSPSGPRTRPTAVLVTGRSEPEQPALLDHLRRRLAAGGVQLFVIDLTPAGAAPVGQLAGPSGGFALRAPDPGHGPGAEGADPLGQALAEIGAALSHQYQVQVQDAAPLPHRIVVSWARVPDTEAVAVDLPVADPAPPARWSLPRPPATTPTTSPAPRTGPRDPFVALAVLMVGSSLVYGMGMLVLSRRTPRRGAAPATAIPLTAGGSVRAAHPGTGHLAPQQVRADQVRSTDPPYFVFLLPCLNEEKVILASLRRLRSMPGDDYAVMVIDDDSDDATAEVVGAVVDDRVWLLQRRAPNARLGKGEALNAAIRNLIEAGRLAGRDPDRVIVVVVDADGRLDPRALDLAGPLFADPGIGAVQIGVRISNRHVNLLARLQDMEFVIYTDVFQRGRRHLNSVGLGGNGQFMRLSALLDLGPAPWSRSLTEDLDLGVRLLALGWRNDFCPGLAVHQQGIPELGRLIRQRTRWFQGHLQSWRLVPTILRSVPRAARADLLYHLSSPFLLLVASFLTASFLVSLLGTALLALQGQATANWWLVSAYVLAFGPATAYTYVYWTHERDDGLSLLRAWGLAHLYVLYGLIWYVSGWKAVVRTLRGRTGWAKTERSAEPPTPAGSDEQGSDEQGGEAPRTQVEHR